MPFIGQAFSMAMFSEMGSKGMVGARLIDLANACGTGLQMSVVGKTFATTDVGTIPGVGTGIGVGLTIPAAIVANTAFAAAVANGLLGAKTLDICTAFGNALAAEAAKISLASSHNPVFLGTGTLIPGSIPILDIEIANNITMLGLSYGFVGASWPMLPQALAKGAAAGFAAAIGSVTISGAFTGPVPPGPIPGVGVGSGIIS